LKTKNIVAVAVASTSSTFSFLGILFLDLFMNWQLIHSPWKDLLLMMLVTIVALGLGVLPYIDLFQSLGTLTCAIVLGVIFVPHLSFGKWDAVRKKVAIAVAVPALFIMCMFGECFGFIYLFISHCRFPGLLVLLQDHQLQLQVVRRGVKYLQHLRKLEIFLYTGWILRKMAGCT